MIGVEHKLATAIDLSAASRNHFDAKIGRAIYIFFLNDAYPAFADEKEIGLRALILREPDSSIGAKNDTEVELLSIKVNTLILHQNCSLKALFTNVNNPDWAYLCAVKF
jgi:hypothetical protein